MHSITFELHFHMPSSATCTRKCHVSGNTNEVDIYLDEPCLDMKENPLAYWKLNEHKFPLLATLSKKYLAVPSTSAPVERLFSIRLKDAH